MEGRKRKNGISLIVLVITILVMIILAGVVVVTMSDNNPIEKAKEATFKTNISEIIAEYNRFLANKQAEIASFNKRTLYASKTNVIYSNMPQDAKEKTVLDIIPSLKGSKYENNIEVMQGEIFYKGKNKKEIKWLDEIGVKIYNIDSAKIVIENGELVSVSSDISGMGTLVIPEGVNKIAPQAFYGCKNLESVILPESVKEIPEGTFAECLKLTKITLPTGLTEIKDRTFYNCQALLQIEIPSSVVKIGRQAFERCISLAKVTGTNSVKVIGHRAFFECARLKEYTLGSNLEVIDDLAFYNTSISIDKLPDSVTKLGSRSLSGCPNITKITIGKNVTTIGEAVFRGNKNLTNITVDTNNPNYKTVDGSLYTKIKVGTVEANTLIFAKPKFDTENGKGVLNVAPGTVAIATDACCENNNITEVVLPDTVTKIGTRAFLFMTDLKKINIPKNLNSIAQENFIACPVTITVDPENVSYFVRDRMLYANTDKGIMLCAVPDDISGTVKVPEDVVAYLPFCFSYNREITSVELSKNVACTEIAPYTCYNMKKVESITVPGNVKVIQIGAFSLLPELQSISFEEGVEKIAASILTGNTKLKQITLPSTLTNVYGAICTRCPDVVVSVRENPNNPNPTIGMLTKDLIGTLSSPKKVLAAVDRNHVIEVPNGVTEISTRAFTDHYITPGVTLPNTVTTIGERVFSDAFNLTELTIPSSVTTIHKYALAGAKKLVDVKIEQLKEGNSLAADMPWGLPAGIKAIKWK